LATYFFTYLSRKVPTPFHEKKGLVIAVSTEENGAILHGNTDIPLLSYTNFNQQVFNIMFTGVVVIIVFFIVESIEPFAAWIIRTVGIVYGFSSTALIIVVPKMFGIVFIDRLGDKKVITPASDGMGVMSVASASASAASMGH
jgi:hypothetical protein